MWRKILEAAARGVHMGGEQPSPFGELREIYTMTDADLLQAVYQTRTPSKKD
jgi:hypothetical protein